jgi:hypothetical protein
LVISAPSEGVARSTNLSKLTEIKFIFELRGALVALVVLTSAEERSGIN